MRFFDGSMVNSYNNFTIHDGGSMQNFNGNSIFNTFGSLIFIGGSSGNTIYLSWNSYNFVEVISGTLSVGGDSYSNASFSIISPGILLFSGGTHTIEAPSTFVGGSGTIGFTGGWTTFLRVPIFNVDISIYGGTLQVSTATTYLNSHLYISYGVLQIDDTIFLNGSSTFEQYGGTVLGGTLELGDSSHYISDSNNECGTDCRDTRTQTLSNVIINIRGTADKYW
jgi:hypothetical protein